MGLQLPKTLKIGAHVYKIRFPFEFNESDSKGMINFNTKEIFLADKACNRDVPESAILKTLIHEILHAIDNITGRNMFNDEYEDENSEKTGANNAVAETLTQILLDNKLIKID